MTAAAFNISDPSFCSGRAAKKPTIAGSDDAKEARLVFPSQKLPFDSAATLTTSDRLIAHMARQQSHLLLRYKFGPLPRDILAALNDERLKIGLADSWPISRQ